MDRNTNFSPASLFDLVALRKESVDRNHDGAGGVTIAASRSPQGERG